MSISYKDSGVDIEKGAELVHNIGAKVTSTHNERVLNSLGSFASLYDMRGFSQPVLVSGTDGVGTKLLLAIEHEEFSTIGQDCVGMCVNDILCHGAKPLFFLDYLACGSLDTSKAEMIIEGIANACRECGCALIGGETAEMPGMYKKGDYDVAGFAVGVVEKNRIIDGSKVAKGDSIIACASSGLHSNGFSLVRALFPDTKQVFDGHSLYKTLLTPTKLYTNSILEVIKNFNAESRMFVNGLAHITGGGIVENLPRIIPDGLWGIVDTNTIKPQNIFELIRNQNEVEEKDLWKTFNMGVGMTLVVSSEQEQDIMALLKEKGEDAYKIGEISDSSSNQAILVESKICLL